VAGAAALLIPCSGFTTATETLLLKTTTPGQITLVGIPLPQQSAFPFLRAITVFVRAFAVATQRLTVSTATTTT
jgi:hypothetical protein